MINLPSIPDFIRRTNPLAALDLEGGVVPSVTVLKL